MSLEALMEAARQRMGIRRSMPHAAKVKAWWPKPNIVKQPEKYWGDRWQNVNSKCRHIYRCESHSAIGFGTRKINPVATGPEHWCFAYGETPEHAYDKWCELFNVWNKEGDWT